MTTWIHAERLVTAPSWVPVRDPWVRVVDGFIAEVTTTSDDVGDAPVLEFPGATLIPGLIDGHTHLAFGGDGTPMADIAHDDDATVQFRTLRNAQVTLASGVTTARDCGGPGFAVPAARDAIASGAFVGPRILSCAMPITTTAGHLHYCGAEADSATELRRTVRRFAKGGVDFIKVCATGGRNTPRSNIYTPQYSVEELTALVNDAHRLGLHVASHALSREGIAVSVEAGVDTVEHCTWFSPEGTDYDASTVSRMIQQGIYGGYNFSGPFHEALDSAGRLDASRIEDGTAPLRRRMREEGAPFFLTTDAGIPRMPHGHFPLSIEVAASVMRLPASAALAAATCEPAQAFGATDIGTLEPGKRADMLVLNRDPLGDLSALRDKRAVLRDGVVCVEQRDGVDWFPRARQ
jgi:imidazolonepropionase-like amidohydrolase